MTTQAHYTKYYSPPPRVRLPDYKPKYEVYKAREHEAKVQQGIPYSQRKQYDVQLVDYKVQCSPRLKDCDSTNFNYLTGLPVTSATRIC